jgi:hypothetical protein
MELKVTEQNLVSKHSFCEKKRNSHFEQTVKLNTIINLIECIALLSSTWVEKGDKKRRHKVESIARYQHHKHLLSYNQFI